MHLLAKAMASALLVAASFLPPLSAQNQTDTLSPVFPEDSLPFTLKIEPAHFTLPVGLQAYACGIYEKKWILIAGRTNGMHTFDPVLNNFPPSFQNTMVYVVDPRLGAVWSRSLTDGSANLSQAEIDSLSVTAPQFCQTRDTLYLVGGYGINTTTGEMETKNTLSAIDLKKLLGWVVDGKRHVKKWLRQVAHPLLQVTGGDLFKDKEHTPFLLMLGQNFAGLYRGNSNGIYTNQIRPFQLHDDGETLSLIPETSTLTFPDYRRRDLNIVPIIRPHHRHPQSAYVAFAGVFTLDDGVWTVPITILPDGSSFEPDPNSPTTFKQAMNHYNCVNFGLYSAQSKEMYVVFAGGISYGFFSEGTFQTDPEFPFINQVTTIRIDEHDQYTQYLMEAEYPFIASKGSNPGNPLLFGAEALFFPAPHIPKFSNDVIQLDKLNKPIVIGYIVGGIMSTLPNTNFSTDSAASPYIFQVKLLPKHCHS